MSRIASIVAPLALGAGWLAAEVAASQEDGAPSIEARAAELVEEAAAVQDWNAGSVLVAVGDEPIFEHGVGRAPDSDLPVEGTTPLRAAPIAHAFLSALTLHRVEEEELELDDDLAALLPGVVGEDANAHVRHLLSHTAGFVDCGDLDDFRAMDGSSWKRLIDVAQQPAVSKPGECVTETTTDTLLLAALLEQHGQLPAAEVLHRTLFDPLEMEDTSVGARGDEIAPREASTDGGSEERPEFDVTSLSTSTQDLLRFQRALVDLELFGSTLARERVEPTKLNDGRRTPWGLGARRVTIAGVEGSAAGGADAEGSARLLYFPAHDLTVAVVALGEEVDAYDLARDLAGLVIDPPDPGLLDLALTEDEQQVYLGTYQVGCNQLILRSEGERLLLDDAARGEVVLLNQGDHRFVAREDHGLRLEFHVEGERADSFLLDDHGVTATATRFEQGAAGR